MKPYTKYADLADKNVVVTGGGTSVGAVRPPVYAKCDLSDLDALAANFAGIQAKRGAVNHAGWYCA